MEIEAGVEQLVDLQPVRGGSGDQEGEARVAFAAAFKATQGSDTDPDALGCRLLSQVLGCAELGQALSQLSRNPPEFRRFAVMSCAGRAGRHGQRRSGCPRIFSRSYMIS